MLIGFSFPLLITNARVAVLFRVHGRNRARVVLEAHGERLRLTLRALVRDEKKNLPKDSPRSPPGQVTGGDRLERSGALQLVAARNP